MAPSSRVSRARARDLRAEGFRAEARLWLRDSGQKSSGQAEVVPSSKPSPKTRLSAT